MNKDLTTLRQGLIKLGIPFRVSNTPGVKGATGATGATGPPGAGVPTGGTIGQVLTKNSSTDYDDSWQTPTVGPSFAENETPSGSGTSWTIAHTPLGSVQLFVFLTGFGGVLLISGNTPGFTISGTTITTTSSYSAGALRVWYRY